MKAVIEFSVQRHERIDSKDVTLVLGANGVGAPRLLYFGRRLPDQLDLVELEMAQSTGWRESTPDSPVAQSIFPVSGWGWMGEPAISASIGEVRGPLSWASCELERTNDELRIELRTNDDGVIVNLIWALDADTGVLSAHSAVRNAGEHPLRLTQLASIYLPLPSYMSQVLAFEGDWSRELRPSRFVTPPGMWRYANRTGRTGFAGSTFATLEPDTGDFTGRVTAVHLAWSGNHELAVETMPDGSRAMIARALLEDGEVILASGETFTTPTAYACATTGGLNGISDGFHPFVRHSVLPATAAAVRKVHFNTWESTYFDFDEKVLLQLAERCAAIGIERFVLDDGWFSGRRDDSSSLGDWIVDTRLFPNGLQPLITTVQGLGMDFGIWVEPEMVSPNSQLYREHPDWCVHAPRGERPTMRNQLWLDMARSEVRAHLFGKIDAMLREYDIAYLKWDCNRFQFPAMAAGRPGSAAIVRGTYDLLDQLRQAHPNVEIESCASGGGRIDLEILKRTTRVWPSDTTDAIERLRIQRWNGLIMPSEVLGAHIGPSPNPITGRQLSMDFRARVALFGHLGVEVDPRGLSEPDLQSLIRHIATYKQYRDLIHGGRMRFWTSADGVDGRAVIANDGGEALILACRGDVGHRGVSAPLQIPGLDGEHAYRVRLVEPWPTPVARRIYDAQGWRSGRTLSGAVLGEVGLRLPLSDPETAWLIHLERCN